jgi:hypothetical protein
MKVLCISTYYKGTAFLLRAHELGHEVYLVTDQKLEHKPWPWHAIKNVFYLTNIENVSSTFETLINGLAAMLRQTKIDVIVALDDFDVEKAALLREQFRINGMGQSTARFFRDKLAMRMQAHSEGIAVPAFSSLFHDIDITEFMQQNPGPWLIKPRSEASATGIRKVNHLQEAWDHIHALGDKRQHYLIECFKPGHVFHVDALIVNYEVVFEQCSQYINTPLEVSHGGGVFRSVTVDYKSSEYSELASLNRKLISAFRMRNGVVHTEIIKDHKSGQLYFLETASRVGGAHLAEQVEIASGINLWAEWASIESAVFEKKSYKTPKRKKDFSGILVTLSSLEKMNYELFSDLNPEWTMEEAYHIGLIFKDNSRDKIEAKLNIAADRIFSNHLHASAPVPDKPNH